MSRNRQPIGTSAERWEQALIEDYRDYRWRRLMEPMCEKMQRWKEGRLTHAEMDRAFEECHQQVCEIRSLFSQRQDRLVLLIQWLDREWFEQWIKSHSPPSGARLATFPD